MFGSAYREFETDPFFNFGDSPFRRHQPQRPMLEDRRAKREARPAEAKGTDFDNAATRQVRGVGDEDSSSRQLERYGGRGSQERQVAQQQRGRGDPFFGAFDDDFALAPHQSMLGGFGSFERHFSQMMSGMQRMMADMGDQMRQMEEAATRDDFDGHMYTHASVYSRRSDGKDGEPHVYQAMSETRTGPGGVRETRRAVRDTRAQSERAAHGRHIGARGHVVERRRNTGTGEQHEDHQYSGIGEAEVDAFDREWHSRATALMADDDAARRRQRALGDRPVRATDAAANGNADRHRSRRAIADHKSSKL